MQTRTLINKIPETVVKCDRLTTYDKKEEHILMHHNVYDLSQVDLYHVSQNKEIKPQFGLGKSCNDYGIGFYTALNEDTAIESAHIDGNTPGYMHKITLDISDLSIYNFNDKPVMYWLTELLSHRLDDLTKYDPEDLRLFMTPYKHDIEEDLIYGWKADEAFHTLTDMVFNDVISMQDIREMMHTGNYGNQLVIRSQNAFDRILSCECIYEVAHNEFSGVNRLCNDLVKYTNAA